jgi:hypothetical protein
VSSSQVNQDAGDRLASSSSVADRNRSGRTRTSRPPAAGRKFNPLVLSEIQNAGDSQQVSSFMLRLGRHYPGKKTWGRAHMNWLMQQKLEQREQRIALEELLGAVRQESKRVEDPRPGAEFPLPLPGLMWCTT